MNTIIMKINGYDEDSQSLLVSFASDITKSQDPSEYVSLAYQPFNMFPDVTNPNEIPKLIAKAGMYHVQQQANKENFLADANTINAYKAMVGQTLTFSVADLTTEQTSQ